MTRLRTLHQFHPTIAYGDAVSNDCFELQRLAWRWGVRSDLFAQEAKPQVRAFVRPYREIPADRPRPEELLLVHVSMGNDALEEVAQLPLRRAVVYHNITPARFFDGLNEHARRYAELGREQLSRLALRSELGIGDSEFNRAELEALGFARTAVVPILVDQAAYEVEPDARVTRMLADERTDVLVVGQILPQKAIHDVIASFARYRERDRGARLHLVGSTAMSAAYLERLRADVSRLRLDDAVRFAGSVSLSELVAYYRGASVLLTLSDHEGFCVPLVEAMRFGLPVVAHAAGAIPETLGEAGLLLGSKEPDAVADALERVVRDAALRSALAEKGRARLGEFSLERVGERLREALVLVGLEAPVPRPRRVVVVSSDERCGIHHYSKAVADGFRAAGHEATFVGVVRADAADMRRKLGRIRSDTDAVLIEHEAGIFRDVPFVLGLLRLRLRRLPVVLSLHELEPDKFHHYRQLTAALHYGQRYRWPLELVRIPWVALRLAWRFVKYRTTAFLMGALPAKLVLHSPRSMKWIDALTGDRRKVEEMPLVLMPLEDARLPSDAAEKRELRRRLGIPEDRFVFVSPGFFFRRKRFLEVLSVLPDDAFLVLSGTESRWDEGYLEEVRAYIRQRGMTNVLVNTEYETMGEFVAASDALVLFYEDVFQSAIAVQAVWAGIPAIYSDVPGFRLYEGAGLFAADVHSLREAMAEIQQPETYAELVRDLAFLRRMLAAERDAERYIAGIPLRDARR